MYNICVQHCIDCENNIEEHVLFVVMFFLSWEKRLHWVFHLWPAVWVIQPSAKKRSFSLHKTLPLFLQSFSAIVEILQ